VRGDSVWFLFSDQFSYYPAGGSKISVYASACEYDPGCPLNNEPYNRGFVIQVTQAYSCGSCIYKSNIVGTVQ
jgi:hypothetical protein